jgi:hypothetical protein
LPTDPASRKLAKLDLIATLVLNSAKAKGVTKVMGIDFGDSAVERVHREVLSDPAYWIAVFDKVMVIANL